MIWQNPRAWLGLLLVAVPIIVHLLARRSARVQPFPTLRFLRPTPPRVARRTRVTDPLLLAVRIAIVVAAVAALAGPLWMTADRDAAAARAFARVIIVDTSASVLAAPAARSAAASDVSSAAAGVIIETAAPGELLPGAAAWLETRRERGEIIVYSDFQLGSIDSLDLAAIPDDIGVLLRRVASASTDSVVMRTVRNVALRIDVPAANYEWTQVDADSGSHDVVVLGNDTTRAGVTAAMRAADVRGASLIRRPIALLFDDSGRIDARALTQPWMSAVVAALRGDALLRASVARADTFATPQPWLAVTADGIIAAAAGTHGGVERLILRVRGEAGSIATAAVIAALSRATAADVPVAELDPRHLDDAQLRAWQREATDAAAVGVGDASDGRWVWAFVLLLLLAETIVRSRRTVDRP